MGRVRVIVAVMVAIIAALVTGFDFANPSPRVVSHLAIPKPDSLSSVLRAHPTVITPERFRSTYLRGVHSTGRGETIALIEFAPGGYRPTAMATFDRAFHLPPPVVYQTCTYSQCNQSVSSVTAEMMLDTEWSHVMAPRANLAVIYWSPANGPGSLAAALRSINPASVAVCFGTVGVSAMTGLRLPLSSPIGIPGLAELPAPDFAPLAHYPTFVATGDFGPGAAIPAMLPWVTAVGGVTQSGHHRVAAWSGSDRGIADLAYGRPSWQPSSAGLFRAIPDVSELAGPPGVIIRDTSWFHAYGTSLAAPLWAGIVALADSERLTENELPFRGNLDPILYRIARHDRGAFTNSSGTYWNSSTGLGVPKVATLVSALVAVPNAESTNDASTGISGWQVFDVVLAILLVGTLTGVLILYNRARRPTLVTWSHAIAPSVFFGLLLGVEATAIDYISTAGKVLAPVLILLIIGLDAIVVVRVRKRSKQRANDAQPSSNPTTPV